MQLTRIIAIRHGETDWNTSGRIQGHTDIPLNSNGVWQAGQMAQALQDSGIDQLYSSDLQRTWQTAAALQATTGLKILAAPALRERCFGELEGKTFAEVQTSSPESAVQWQQRNPDFQPAGGESLVQFSQRVIDCVLQLARNHAGQQIALITHGGVLDMLYRHANGLDLQAQRTWSIDNTSINRFLWSPESFTLVGWADNAHLENAGLDEAWT